MAAQERRHGRRKDEAHGLPDEDISSEDDTRYSQSGLKRPLRSSVVWASFPIPRFHAPPQPVAFIPLPFYPIALFHCNFELPRGRPSPFLPLARLPSVSRVAQRCH